MEVLELLKGKAIWTISCGQIMIIFSNHFQK